MKDAFDDGRPRILSEKQCSYLNRWVRNAADQLGLRDWRLMVSPFDSEKSSDASSHIKDQSDEMVVAVGRDFLSVDPDEQRATLTHELLHPHFYRVTRLSETLIEAELGKRTEAIIDSAVRLTEELTIERLAHAVAVWLPPVAMPDA